MQASTKKTWQKGGMTSNERKCQLYPQKNCDMPKALYISWVFLYNMLVCDSMKEMGRTLLQWNSCDF
jgi:hypothetical protein